MRSTVIWFDGYSIGGSTGMLDGLDVRQSIVNQRTKIAV
jgi:hypothetical protein